VSDESVIGGLSLLLMAGQHTAAVTASCPLTGTDNLLHSREVLHLPPSQVISTLTFYWILLRTVQQ